jgi:hypothetical protein
MKHQHIDEQLLETVMQEVEMEFQLAGLVSPRPGFLQRWQTRLDQQRIASEKKQVWMFMAIFGIIALGFFTLIGLRFVPVWHSNGSFLSFWINLFTQVVIFFKTIGTIIETLLRTLPGLVPPSWWVNVIVSAVVLLLLWVVLMRQFVQKQGVLV